MGVRMRHIIYSYTGEENKRYTCDKPNHVKYDSGQSTMFFEWHRSPQSDMCCRGFIASLITIVRLFKAKDAAIRLGWSWATDRSKVVDTLPRKALREREEYGVVYIKLCSSYLNLSSPWRRENIRSTRNPMPKVMSDERTSIAGSLLRNLLSRQHRYENRREHQKLPRPNWEDYCASFVVDRAMQWTGAWTERTREIDDNHHIQLIPTKFLRRKKSGPLRFCSNTQRPLSQGPLNIVPARQVIGYTIEFDGDNGSLSALLARQKREELNSSRKWPEPDDR